MDDGFKPAKVLLLHLPGADWRLIGPLLDAGHLPHLDGFINRGTIGNLAAVSPMRHPVSTLSLATGSSAHHHGVFGPIKPDSAAQCVRPVYRPDVQRPYLWDYVQAAGKRAFAVGWPGAYPAISGGASVVTDVFSIPRGKSFETWPLDPKALSPDLPRDLLQDLRLHTNEVTPQMLLPFIEAADKLDIETDERLGLLAGVLARTSTIHAAGTWAAETQDWDCLAIHFDFVERLTTAFLQYMPPRLPHVTQTDFDIYKSVVEGAYRFFDLLLQRYLELIDPDCHVLIASDHGYYVADLRQPPIQGLGWAASMLRPLGILAACGPTIKQDELVFGPMQVDIAPTVLSILGIAAPPGISGKPIAELFAAPLKVSTLEQRAGVSSPEDLTAIDPALSQHLMSEFVALGHIAKVPDDGELACEAFEISWALSRSNLYITQGKYREALESLEEVFALSPDSSQGLLNAAQCYIALKDVERCRQTIADLKAAGIVNAHSLLFQAQLAVLEKDKQEAMTALEAAQKRLPAGIPGKLFASNLANVWLSIQGFERAEKLFRETLALDEDNVIANGGLGKALFGQKRYAEAITALQRSIGGLQQQPQIHSFLGRCYYQLKDRENAARCYRAALEITPGFKMAERGLARLGHDIALQNTPKPVPEGIE
jgi:tetratricopeptide (TPR) repeat protein